MRIYPSDSAPATSRQQERRKRPSSHCCCCPSLPGPSRTQATYISTGTCCSQVRPLFSDSRDPGPTLSPTISALRPRHELGALARRSSPTSLKPIHFLSFALPLRHTSIPGLMSLVVAAFTCLTFSLANTVSHAPSSTPVRQDGLSFRSTSPFRPSWRAPLPPLQLQYRSSRLLAPSLTLW